MEKEQLIERLVERHQALIRFVEELTETDFNYQPDQKWTAGQQLEHILLSLQQLNTGLKIPKLILRTTFGLANRPSRDYEGVVEKYKEKLADGGKAPSKYVPKKVVMAQRNKLSDDLQISLVKLQKGLDKFSETELDKYILPHPLLGKMTLREMLCFMHYHTDFHLQSIKTNLKN